MNYHFTWNVSVSINDVKEKMIPLDVVKSKPSVSGNSGPIYFRLWKKINLVLKEGILYLVLIYL